MDCCKEELKRIKEFEYGAAEGQKRWVGLIELLMLEYYIEFLKENHYGRKINRKVEMNWEVILKTRSVAKTYFRKDGRWKNHRERLRLQ